MAWRSCPPNFICKHCGAPFENVGHRRELLFCSRTCFSLSQRVPEEIQRERARLHSQEVYRRNPKANMARVKAWKEANPEKVRAVAKRRREKLSAQRALLREARREAARPEREARRAVSQEKARERGRQRYAAMTDEERSRFLFAGKVWRAKNKERNRALIRAWKKAHPEARREERRGRDRKSKKRRREWLMGLQKGRCGYCRVKLGTDSHIDHIMPLALGGTNRRANLQLLCAPCNLSKSATHPVEFAQSLGRLI